MKAAVTGASKPPGTPRRPKESVSPPSRTPVKPVQTPKATPVQTPKATPTPPAGGIPYHPVLPIAPPTSPDALSPTAHPSMLRRSGK